MTIAELFKLKDGLSERLDRSSKNLNKGCAPHKGVYGLVSDEYRHSGEYASLNNLYQFDKQQMRAFWKLVQGNKEFKKADRERTLAKRYSNSK
jgi:hypothetical protein